MRWNFSDKWFAENKGFWVVFSHEAEGQLVVATGVKIQWNDSKNNEYYINNNNKKKIFK